MSGTTCDVECIDHKAASRARSAADRFVGGEALRQLRAVADPVRLGLLAAVVDQEDLCACDLAWVVDRQKSLVSHHLKQLRDARLIDSRREGRLVRYSATRMGLQLLSALDACVAPEVVA